MHFYSQVASIVTFLSDYSVKIFILVCLRSIETKKLRAKIVIPQLPSLILLVTRRDVQLEHCIVPSVLVSSQKSQKQLNYHFAKRHSVPNPARTFKSKFCYQEFPGFYALRQHKNIQHGFLFKRAIVDADDIINENDDANLKEELRSCQHFPVDFELERARHKVFNFAIENLDAKTVHEKLDHFFKNLKCAAKVNLAFGLNLRNIEDGGFR